MTKTNGDKSLESWIWDAACSIRGAKDAPKYKEFILPLLWWDLQLRLWMTRENCAELPCR